MIYLVIGLPDLHLVMYRQSKVKAAVDSLTDGRYDIVDLETVR